MKTAVTYENREILDALPLQFYMGSETDNPITVIFNHPGSPAGRGKMKGSVQPLKTSSLKYQ